MSKDLLKKPGSAEEIAKQQLSRILREEISRDAHAENNELSQQLLLQILSEVNWLELAEDLLAEQDAINETGAEKSKS